MYGLVQELSPTSIRWAYHKVLLLKQHSLPELLLLGEVVVVMQEHPSPPMASPRHSTSLSSFSLCLLWFVKIIPSWDFPLPSKVHSTCKNEMCFISHFLLFSVELCLSWTPALPQPYSVNSSQLNTIMWLPSFPPIVMGAQVTSYSINPCNLCPKLRDLHKLWKKPLQSREIYPWRILLMSSINPASYR